MTRLTRLHTALSLATMLAVQLCQTQPATANAPTGYHAAAWQPGYQPRLRQNPGITTPARRRTGTIR